MTAYQLTKQAEEDLIRISQYGVEHFGVIQADKYFAKISDCI